MDQLSPPLLALSGDINHLRNRIDVQTNISRGIAAQQTENDRSSSHRFFVTLAILSLVILLFICLLIVMFRLP